MTFESDFKPELIPHHVLCIWGFLTNLMLLVAFAKDPLKCFKNTAPYLLANLGLADMLYCLTASFRAYLPKNNTKAVGFDWFAYVSGITLLTIAADRFFMVAYPIKYRHIVNKKRTKVLIIIITWFLGTCFHLKRWTIGQKKYDVHLANTMPFFGLLIMVGFHMKTYKVLRKQFKLVRPMQRNLFHLHKKKSLLEREQRLLKTIIILTCVCVATFAPKLIYEEIVNIKYTSNRSFEWETDDKTFNALTVTFATIFTVNFAAHPLIYFLYFPKYRRTFVHLFIKRTRRL